MPIAGIVQPEVIQVDNTLRLRKFDGVIDAALAWYQDPEMVWLVDGVRESYTMEKLQRMYTYLDSRGELYWIESLQQGSYHPIGDVTFWQEDMPIVIGDPACRGKGVGRQVVAALVQRGRELGYPAMYVNEIYHYNEASRRCFESAGFRMCEETEKGWRMKLEG